VAASGAGTWVAQQSAKLASVCGGKGVLITGMSLLKLTNSESGWPSAGSANGAAVASHSNHATAKSSILSAMGNKVCMFSAFDDPWKAPGQYGIEQYWVSLPSDQVNPRDYFLSPFN
jgi:exo-beta-1,3-glucanase (GH17 family)